MFPNAAKFFLLILAYLRDLDASMVGPTKKCPRFRKEKPVDAKFRHNPAGSIDDEDDDDEFALRNIHNHVLLIFQRSI
jgi:hypothetical protein